jgi:hypothetical protein
VEISIWKRNHQNYMAGSADASWQALPIAHRLARAQDQVKARAPGLERWRQQYRLSAHMKMDEASMGQMRGVYWKAQFIERRPMRGTTGR